MHWFILHLGNARITQVSVLHGDTPRAAVAAAARYTSDLSSQIRFCLFAKDTVCRASIMASLIGSCNLLRKRSVPKPAFQKAYTKAVLLGVTVSLGDL
jgi:hypothetical protein